MPRPAPPGVPAPGPPPPRPAAARSPGGCARPSDGRRGRWWPPRPGAVPCRTCPAGPRPPSPRGPRPASRRGCGRPGCRCWSRRRRWGTSRGPSRRPAGRGRSGSCGRRAGRRARGLAGDLDVEVGIADRAADVGGAALVGEVLDGFALFGVPGGVEDPVLAVVDGQEGSVGVLVRQVADDEPAVAHHVGETARAEGDADVVEEVAGSALADAELFADGAAGAVGGDQVVRADGGVLAGLPALHDRRDALGVGLEGEQFGAEAQVAAEVRGVREEFGLQVVLAAQAPGAGAEAGQSAARVDLLEQPLPRVAGQGRRLEDAVVVGQRGGGPADVRLGAGHPEDLHRADVVAAPAGWMEVPACRSTRVCRTPSRPRNTEVDRPTRDPPTTRTGTRWVRSPRGRRRRTGRLFRS